MTSPVGFLDFFVLEANEYIEQLDGLLVRSTSTGPDAEQIMRTARVLRGSATMAKLPSFAELAGSVERVARALRDGAIAWEPALGGAVIAAVDDLKILLRSARDWAEADDQRAATRAAELARYAPERQATNTPSTTSGTAFLAAEAANVGAGLELMATRPADRDGATNVLRRVRALRGVAGLRELPSLAEAMEAAEIAAKSLEIGSGPLSPEALQLLRAAAALLRQIATAIRAGAPADVQSPERRALADAMDSFGATETMRDRIVPVSELYFDDGGENVVSTAPNPPTTPAERFRLEAVSQGEHLRGLVAEARKAPDDDARERMRREVRRTLRSLRALAESFGEGQVAELVTSHENAAATLDADSLAALDGLAAVLARPSAPAQPPARPSQPVSSTAPTPIVSPAVKPERKPPMTPVIPATPARPLRPLTPAMGTPALSRERISGEHLALTLDQSISGLDSLAATAMASAPAPEQPAISVDALVYRGTAAIQRAIEIRDELRRAGTQPNPEALDEIFDLLDLALAG